MSRGIGIDPDLPGTCYERERDDEFIAAYIGDLNGLFESGYHLMTIEGLKPVTKYENKEIQKALVNFLVRARNYNPDYVEDLLLCGEFQQEITDAVLADSTSERLADLLNNQVAVIIYDLFILGPETLRTELMCLFFKSLELSSFQEFTVLIIREILNIVLGEVVFSVPKDAPSRQFLEVA